MRRISFFLGVCFLALLVASDAATGCTDCDGDGHAWPADCNDANAGIYPGATETCDGFDNDCDGVVDNAPPCDNTCDAPAQLGADLRLTDATGLSDVSSLAWNGNGYGIAWADRRSGSFDQIWFTRLTSTGIEVQSALPITSMRAMSST